MDPEAEQHGEPGRVGRLVLFSGRVQGVGFRYTACHIARHFTVTGYVRNLPDGRVELLAEGDSEELERFVGAIRDELGEYIRDQQASDRPASGAYRDFGIAF